MDKFPKFKIVTGKTPEELILNLEKESVVKAKVTEPAYTYFETTGYLWWKKTVEHTSESYDYTVTYMYKFLFKIDSLSVVLKLENVYDDVGW